MTRCRLIDTRNRRARAPRISGTVRVVQKAAKPGRRAEPGGRETAQGESIRNPLKEEMTGIEEPKFPQIMEFLPAVVHGAIVAATRGGNWTRV